MMKVKQILFFILILSGCQEAAKNFFDNPFVAEDKDKNVILRRPQVSSVKIEGGVIILEGSQLDRITNVEMQGKTLSIARQSEKSVMALASEALGLYVNEVSSFT